jgi:hypothetical protein
MINVNRLGRAAFGVTGVTAIATAGPAYAGGSHIAAYSDQEDAWGVGNDAPCEGQGRATAKRLCIQNGGTDCRLASTTQNGCVAMAVGAALWAGGHGGTGGEAIASAIERAGGAGSVQVSLCTARRLGPPQIVD